MNVECPDGPARDMIEIGCIMHDLGCSADPRTIFSETKVTDIFNKGRFQRRLNFKTNVFPLQLQSIDLKFMHSFMAIGFTVTNNILFSGKRKYSKLPLPLNN